MAGSGPERRKRGRLSRSGDFDRAYRDGRSHANRYIVLYAFPRSSGVAADAPPNGSESESEQVRLGISVGRRVGNAVERNRVKRAIRECFWELAERLPEGHDFVVVARSEVGAMLERDGSDGLKSAIEELVKQAVGE